MMVDTYNGEGKKVGTTDLPDRVFGARWRAALVKQVYLGELANQRLAWAHTKDRSEVRGGGKKPWRQKGLGKARHGSIRSPIWVGGGITHGPRNQRAYTVTMNKKMKHASLRSVLSRKLKEKEIILVDAFTLSRSKTKEAAAVFANLRSVAAFKRVGEVGGRTLLAVLRKPEIMRSVRNLPFVEFQEARNINTASLLHHKFVLFDRAAIDILVHILA